MMTDTPVWINTALQAAQEAVKETPLNISSTRRSGNGLRNADEAVNAALSAFMRHVPYCAPACSCENCQTLHLLKSTFAEPDHAK
jgi:hypothetical protein